jgi:hypothetical protein
MRDTVAYYNTEMIMPIKRFIEWAPNQKELIRIPELNHQQFMKLIVKRKL